MSSRIHMETEQVRHLANRLRHTAEHYDDAFEHLSRRVHGMRWESPSRDRFMNRYRSLSNNARRTAAELDRLAQLLVREVEQWEEVARSFGGDRGSGGGGASINWPGGKKIGNMQDLADMLMDSNAPPIRIVEINPGEYVILIQGTTFDFSKGHNWGAAIMAGFGLPTEYERQVKKLIEDAKLPPNAKIHLVGHSQGGIVANHLADQLGFSSRYDIASVTTFGSPQHINHYLSPDKFHQFRAGDDIVPFLNLGTAAALFSLLTLGIPLSQAASIVLPNQKYVNSGTIDPIASHLAYGKLPELANKDLPFTNISQWTVKPVGETVIADSGLSGSLSDVFSGDPLKIARGLIDTPFELVDSFVAGSANVAIDGASAILPAPLARQLDAYRDRVMENYACSPTPVDMAMPLISTGAQVVQNAAQYTSQLASQAGQQVLQTLNFFATPVF